MGKGQAHRIKGNVKPSNSQKAAEILYGNSSLNTKGFIGFDSFKPQHLTVPDKESRFHIPISKLSKKDALTKIKALKDILEILTESTQDYSEFVSMWVSLFEKLHYNLNFQIREISKLISELLIKQNVSESTFQFKWHILNTTDGTLPMITKEILNNEFKVLKNFDKDEFDDLMFVSHLLTYLNMLSVQEKHLIDIVLSSISNNIEVINYHKNNQTIANIITMIWITCITKYEDLSASNQSELIDYFAKYFNNPKWESKTVFNTWKVYLQLLKRYHVINHKINIQMFENILLKFIDIPAKFKILDSDYYTLLTCLDQAFKILANQSSILNCKFIESFFTSYIDCLNLIITKLPKHTLSENTISNIYQSYFACVNHVLVTDSDSDFRKDFANKTINKFVENHTSSLASYPNVAPIFINCIINFLTQNCQKLNKSLSPQFTYNTLHQMLELFTPDDIFQEHDDHDSPNNSRFNCQNSYEMVNSIFNALLTNAPDGMDLEHVQVYTHLIPQVCCKFITFCLFKNDSQLIPKLLSDFEAVDSKCDLLSYLHLCFASLHRILSKYRYFTFNTKEYRKICDFISLENLTRESNFRDFQSIIETCLKIYERILLPVSQESKVDLVKRRQMYDHVSDIILFLIDEYPFLSDDKPLNNTSIQADLTTLMHSILIKRDFEFSCSYLHHIWKISCSLPQTPSEKLDLSTAPEFSLQFKTMLKTYLTSLFISNLYSLCDMPKLKLDTDASCIILDELGIEDKQKKTRLIKFFFLNLFEEFYNLQNNVPPDKIQIDFEMFCTDLAKSIENYSPGSTSLVRTLLLTDLPNFVDDKSFETEKIFTRHVIDIYLALFQKDYHSLSQSNSSDEGRDIIQQWLLFLRSLIPNFEESSLSNLLVSICRISAPSFPSSTYHVTNLSFLIQILKMIFDGFKDILVGKPKPGPSCIENMFIFIENLFISILPTDILSQSLDTFSKNTPQLRTLSYLDNDIDNLSTIDWSDFALTAPTTRTLPVILSNLRAYLDLVYVSCYVLTFFSELRDFYDDLMQFERVTAENRAFEFSNDLREHMVLDNISVILEQTLQYSNYFEPLDGYRFVQCNSSQRYHGLPYKALFQYNFYQLVSELKNEDSHEPFIQTVQLSFALTRFFRDRLWLLIPPNNTAENMKPAKITRKMIHQSLVTILDIPWSSSQKSIVLAEVRECEDDYIAQVRNFTALTLDSLNEIQTNLADTTFNKSNEVSFQTDLVLLTLTKFRLIRHSLRNGFINRGSPLSNDLLTLKALFYPFNELLEYISDWATNSAPFKCILDISSICSNQSSNHNDGIITPFKGETDTRILFFLELLQLLQTILEFTFHCIGHNISIRINEYYINEIGGRRTGISFEELSKEAATYQLTSYFKRENWDFLLCFLLSLNSELVKVYNNFSNTSIGSQNTDAIPPTKALFMITFIRYLELLNAITLKLLHGFTGYKLSNCWYSTLNSSSTGTSGNSLALINRLEGILDADLRKEFREFFVPSFFDTYSSVFLDSTMPKDSTFLSTSAFYQITRLIYNTSDIGCNLNSSLTQIPATTDIFEIKDMYLANFKKYVDIIGKPESTAHNNACSNNLAFNLTLKLINNISKWIEAVGLTNGSNAILKLDTFYEELFDHVMLRLGHCVQKANLERENKIYYGTCISYCSILLLYLFQKLLSKSYTTGDCDFQHFKLRLLRKTFTSLSQKGRSTGSTTGENLDKDLDRLEMVGEFTATSNNAESSGKTENQSDITSLEHDSPIFNAIIDNNLHKLLIWTQTHSTSKPERVKKLRQYVANYWRNFALPFLISSDFENNDLGITALAVMGQVPFPLPPDQNIGEFEWVLTSENFVKHTLYHIDGGKGLDSILAVNRDDYEDGYIDSNMEFSLYNDVLLQLIITYMALKEIPNRLRHIWDVSKDTYTKSIISDDSYPPIPKTKKNMENVVKFIFDNLKLGESIVQLELDAVSVFFDKVPNPTKPGNSGRGNQLEQGKKISFVVDATDENQIKTKHSSANTNFIPHKTYTVKVKRKVREVVAKYETDDFAIEIEIKIPARYPLDHLVIDCGKRVGVTQLQWRSWLLQLKALIIYRDGPIIEGLKLWKRNMERYLNGAVTCMICFGLIDPKEYALHKNTCPQCKNKYHANCLYKWFRTSLNTTCPLCRYRFFT